jgi:predicted ATPase
MRIKSVRIQNLRSFKDETIEFDRYTAFVGPNGSGKSTVLCALNIFFRETEGSPLNLQVLEEEDFHGGATSEPITVTVTFCDLSDEAQKDFAHYYRQGELVVSAEAWFDPDTKRATVLQYGQRKGIPDLARFFLADKQKAGIEDLRKIYEELRAARPDLPAATTKPRMTDALRVYEETRPEETELLPSNDEFYGYSKGANRLARHVQWVFVPAVKDASTEQAEAKDTALGKLLARTVRARIKFDEQVRAIRTDAQSKYEEMLEEQQAALNEISATLKARLAEWAHPDAHVELKWHQDPEKSVRIDEPFAQIVAGEGPFSGSLARLGHGFQRAYLLALLQELSRTGGETEPTLLLAVEEPELYQHPPQCRHMSKVLQDLADGNSQVMITTHSPLFVPGDNFASVRLVRKEPVKSESSTSFVSMDRLMQVLAEVRDQDPPKVPRGVLAKIYQALQPALSEIFFTPHLVLVEGPEDVAYILTYMNLLGKADDVRRVGCHFVPADGKSSLLIPLAIVKELGVPVFVVFDADAHTSEERGVREKHRKDNLALLRLVGVQDPEPLPAATMWTDRSVMWCTEVGREIAAEFPDQWRELKEEIEVRFGQAGGLNKNPLFIAELLEEAWNRGLRSQKLGELCRLILVFCGATPPHSTPAGRAP